MTALARLDVALPAAMVRHGGEEPPPADPFAEFDDDLSRIPARRTRADRQRRVLGFVAFGFLGVTALAVWAAFKDTPKGEEPAPEDLAFGVRVEVDGSITIQDETWLDPGELPTSDHVPDGGPYHLIIRHPRGLESRAEELGQRLGELGQRVEIVLMITATERTAHAPQAIEAEIIDGEIDG